MGPSAPAGHGVLCPVYCKVLAGSDFGLSFWPTFLLGVGTAWFGRFVLNTYIWPPPPTTIIEVGESVDLGTRLLQGIVVEKKGYSRGRHIVDVRLSGGGPGACPLRVP